MINKMQLLKSLEALFNSSDWPSYSLKLIDPSHAVNQEQGKILQEFIQIGRLHELLPAEWFQVSWAIHFFKPHIRKRFLFKILKTIISNDNSKSRFWLMRMFSPWECAIDFDQWCDDFSLDQKRLVSYILLFVVEQERQKSQMEDDFPFRVSAYAKAIFDTYWRQFLFVLNK